MIVRVLHGRKTLRYAGGEFTATAGQWLLIVGGQQAVAHMKFKLNK